MIDSVGDDLIRWASEREGGSWTAFSETAAHSMSVRKLTHPRPWQLAADLSALGHIDIDWDEGRWSVAAPCLVLARGMGLCVYLAGWRNARLLARFDEAADDPSIFPFSIRQDPAPRAVYAKCDSVASAESVAERLGVPLVLDPARQVVERLEPSPPSTEPAAPPPIDDDEDVDFFDANKLAWFPARRQPFAEGLHRYELHGRKVFRLHRGDWFKVDRAGGQLAVLRDRSDVMWSQRASPDLTTPPALMVNAAISLPALAERAAVSASGLLPHRTAHARVYRNVSPSIAELIGEKLQLKVPRKAEPAANWKDPR